MKVEDRERYLKQISENNWKVKKLLEDCGGYENIPTHLQAKLDKMIHELKTKEK